MKEKFIDTRFRGTSLAIIEKANEIIAEYDAMNLSLTLRQLYYRFVARGLIENTVRSYKNLGSTINDARLAGLIDWNSIEDRTRNVETVNMWSHPSQVISATANQYRENPWLTQGWRPEVWVEKEALVGVVEQPCRELRVPWLACRGYLSQSESYSAGKRFAQAIRNGFRPIIFHLGDHDPSGIDMTRDNGDRLAMLARQGVLVRRLALNMDQVEEYDPPPNPAKETDSRFEGYRSEFGDESWELDALDPPVIQQLIRDAVNEIIDPDPWAVVMEREEERRTQLKEIASRWSEIVEFIDGTDSDEGLDDE